MTLLLWMRVSLLTSVIWKDVGLCLRFLVCLDVSVIYVVLYNVVLVGLVIVVYVVISVAIVDWMLGIRVSSGDFRGILTVLLLMKIALVRGLLTVRVLVSMLRCLLLNLVAVVWIMSGWRFSSAWIWLMCRGRCLTGAVLSIYGILVRWMVVSAGPTVLDYLEARALRLNTMVLVELVVVRVLVAALATIDWVLVLQSMLVMKEAVVCGVM